jgi:hypothetical protein
VATVLASNLASNPSYFIMTCGTRARICRPFKETGNRFPAWRAGTTTLFFVPARQATYVGKIDSWESIPGLHKRQQIRALL